MIKSELLLRPAYWSGDVTVVVPDSAKEDVATLVKFATTGVLPADINTGNAVSFAYMIPRAPANTVLSFQALTLLLALGIDLSRLNLKQEENAPVIQIEAAPEVIETKEEVVFEVQEDDEEEPEEKKSEHEEEEDDDETFVPLNVEGDFFEDAEPPAEEEDKEEENPFSPVQTRRRSASRTTRSGGRSWSGSTSCWRRTCTRSGTSTTRRSSTRTSSTN